MAEAADRPYSYDAVPYPNYPYPQTHPDRLATVATLFGMTPRAIDACRVLEIGCGRGGNVIPLAEAFPNSRFVGIDLSEVQVSEARGFAGELGLANITLERKDILEVDAGFGQFDYILCHGVYSWVPDHVQEKILDICATNLAGNGVAYVSYNTYPGWHVRDMVRHMMQYHASKFPDPKEHVAQARALLDFVAETVSEEDDVYGTLLKREVELLRKHSDAYLFHDHLERVNAPIYFHQFAERVAAKGLQYLGESQISTMYTGNLPAEVAKTLKRVARDLIQMEQYMDFVRNRSFRQTLLCQGDVAVDRRLRAEHLEGLYAASPLAPAEGEDAIASTKEVRFEHRDSDRHMSTTNPLLKAAMARLAEVWPGRAAYPQLAQSARSRLKVPSVESPERVARQSLALGRALLKCYVANLVELHSVPERFSVSVSERPTAGAMARLQARLGNSVTNRCHQSVRVNDLDRHVLQHLDGTRDRDQVLDGLVKLAGEGVLVVHKNAASSDSDEDTRGRLAEALDESLSALATKALLVG